MSKRVQIEHTRQAIQNLTNAIEELKGEGVPKAGIKEYVDRLQEERRKLARLEAVR